MPIKMIIQGIAFFSFCLFIAFSMLNDSLGASGNKDLFPISIILISTCFVFILGFGWRFFVRFYSKNNMIILGKDKIIIPGFLQLFSEVEIRIAEVERVEYLNVGNGTNYLIKFYLKNRGFPVTFSRNNSISLTEFEEIHSTVLELIKENNKINSKLD